MKRTSIFGVVLVTAIALSIPTIAWGQIDPNVSSDGDITEEIAETVMPSHRGRRGGQGRHGGQGGCW